MNRFPTDLDLSGAVGQQITQLLLGEFDVQFDIGPVHFNIQSPIELTREGNTIGRWEERKWPDESFLRILNVEVVGYSIPADNLLLIQFKNGIEMRLVDSSDQYESMTISFQEPAAVWVV